MADNSEMRVAQVDLRWCVENGCSAGNHKPGCPAERMVTEENGRLREGLRRLVNLDYDSGYTAESYAEAILSGFEPSGEATT